MAPWRNPGWCVLNTAYRLLLTLFFVCLLFCLVIVCVSSHSAYLTHYNYSVYLGRILYTLEKDVIRNCSVDSQDSSERMRFYGVVIRRRKIKINYSLLSRGPMSLLGCTLRSWVSLLGCLCLHVFPIQPFLACNVRVVLIVTNLMALREYVSIRNDELAKF